MYLQATAATEEGVRVASVIGLPPRLHGGSYKVSYPFLDTLRGDKAAVR